jgi:hypothetical protein
MIGLIARPAPLSDQEAIAAAVTAARAAEVAVVVVGLTSEHETESADKKTLVLPGNQDALVEAVAAAARRTVVVVNAATPVLMPWADRVSAILVAGLPGPEGGHAVLPHLLGSGSAPVSVTAPGTTPTPRSTALKPHRSSRFRCATRPTGIPERSCRHISHPPTLPSLYGSSAGPSPASRPGESVASPSTASPACGAAGTSPPQAGPNFPLPVNCSSQGA